MTAETEPGAVGPETPSIYVDGLVSHGVSQSVVKLVFGETIPGVGGPYAWRANAVVVMSKPNLKLLVATLNAMLAHPDFEKSE